jgi:hypothetical protein
MKSKQKTGGSVARSPGDKIKGAREHKPGKVGLSPTGGSSNRGKGC